MSIIEDFNDFYSKVNHIINGLFEILQPYKKDNVKITDENQHVFTRLQYHLYETSFSILVLISKELFFDAEILLRRLVEGSIKLVCLLQGDLSNTTKDMREYLYTLPEIGKIETHKKLLKF